MPKTDWYHMPHTFLWHEIDQVLVWDNIELSLQHHDQCRNYA